MGDVYIIGSGMIKFGKYLERGIKDLTGEAAMTVHILERAG
jgi:acetyl-CoA acetyltransferase